MNTGIMKCIVNDETFESILSNGYGMVEIQECFACKSDIRKMDYLVFVNSNNKSVLKRFWAMDGMYIQYTSVFAYNCSNLEYQVLCETMYDSIQFLRLSLTKGKIFRSLLRKGMKREISTRLQLLEMCVMFIQHELSLQDLISCTGSLENIPNVKLLGKLITNPFDFEIDSCNSSLMTIKAAIDSMKSELGNPFHWARIGEFAYSIHNEPLKLLKMCPPIVP